MYFDHPHGQLSSATPVEQEKSKNSVPAQATVGPRCLPRTVVNSETITSTFSFGCMAENVRGLLQKGYVQAAAEEGDV